MPSTSKLLDDSVVLKAREGLKELGKSALISRKLQAIISAKTHGISKVATIYNITNKTLTFWIKSLKNGSLSDLSAKAKATRKPLIDDSVIPFPTPNYLHKLLTTSFDKFRTNLQTANSNSNKVSNTLFFITLSLMCFHSLSTGFSSGQYGGSRTI